MFGLIKSTNKILQSSKSTLVLSSRSNSSLIAYTLKSQTRSRFYSTINNGLKQINNKTELIPLTGRFQKLRFNQPRNLASVAPTQAAAPSNIQEQSTQEEVHVDKLRNVAIIAHVDHGKTTLVDQMLKQGGQEVSEDRVMDSNVLEKERGITILAKNTSISWKNVKINVVDTPGHGDFGGEVERIMTMVDGVILVVDASEGVMAQTKFVLSKALKAGKKPIVVLNKLDRVADKRRVDEVEGEIFDLFHSLEATDNQMEYPTLYASGRDGWAKHTIPEEGKNLEPLFDAILEHVPSPTVRSDNRFSMLVSNIEKDNFLGRIVTGRIWSGEVTVGMKLHSLDINGKKLEEGKVTKILTQKGLQKMSISKGIAGDIVGIAGFSQASVTATLCEPDITKAIPSLPLDPPVISVQLAVNTSPLAGKEGKFQTFPQLRKRLEKEIESNVALSLKNTEGREAIEVFGRGELQIGILVENMRREGFELSLSPPKVVFKTGENGERLEPIEEVTIDVDMEYTGMIIEKMAGRKGVLEEMKQLGEKARLIFLTPARTLVGYRNELLTDTKGNAVYNHLFHSYQPFKGTMDGYKKGAIISMSDGVATNYALDAIQPRGVLFVRAQTQVYSGMVIGEHSRDNDIEVNPVKTKHLSNMRAAGKEEAYKIAEPRIFTLEEAIAYMRPDEILEITPTAIRLRKAPQPQKK